MSKRSNPYIEDFVPQSKIHVGVKQFNNNGDRLQKVYGLGAKKKENVPVASLPAQMVKTLELLFRGAKMVPMKNAIEADETSSKKDGLKQLFLGKNCHLMQSGVLEIQSTVECACKRTSDDRCDYCEKDLCASCKHQCERCQLSFCSLCTLVGYDGQEMCLSCLIAN